MLIGYIFFIYFIYSYKFDAVISGVPLRSGFGPVLFHIFLINFLYISRKSVQYSCKPKAF